MAVAAGPGQRLPQTVQRKMEALFGARFDDVRIHVGPQAPALGAAALTQGADIYFAPGRYAPETARGQQLLAHELAHVVQQRSGRARNPSATGVAVLRDPALEAEADRMALRALHVAAPASSAHVAATVVQRMQAPQTGVERTGAFEERGWGTLGSGRFTKVSGIVDAAIRGGGAELATPELALLTGIMATKAVRDAKPATSEGTYAIGINGQMIFATGSGKFGAAVRDAVAALNGTYTFTFIGARDTFVHGETTIYKHDSGVTAIVASQPCCLFCYGFLHDKGIAHPRLRDQPYPKGWLHPDGDLKLELANVDYAKHGKFVWIRYSADSERLYRVLKG